MKLTKRILVVAVMLAVLVSAFAFASSAVFTEDNVDDILEYYYPKYIEEDFETEKLGGYCYPLHHSVSVELKTLGADVVVDFIDSTNKYLSYKFNTANADAGYFGYNFALNSGVSETVFSTKVYAEKREADLLPAYSINLSAFDKKNNPVGEASLVTPVTLDFESGAVYYAKPNATNPAIFSSTAVEDIEFVIEEGVWYTVTLIVDAKENSYSFSIESDKGDLYESAAISLGSAAYITELNSSFSTLLGASGIMCAMDDIEFYRGSMIRGDEDINELTEWTLEGIASLIESDDLGFDAKLKIVEVYDAIFNSNYIPSDADMLSLYESAKLYSNKVYTEIFCNEVAAIDPGKSYARRQDKILELESYFPKMNNDTTYLAAINVVLTALENKVAADYNAAIAVAGADLAALDAAKSAATEAFAAYRESFALKADAQARIDALDDAIASLGSAFASTAEYLPTAIDIITDNENNLAALRLAIAAYNAEIKSLDEVKKDSEGFIEYMKSYNPDSRDYTYILDAYAQISQFELRDNSYNYANNDPDCVYYYIPLLGALEEKIEEMNSIIGKFKESVLIMQDTSRDFDTRFNVGYLSAKEVYNGGKIYDGVDVNTVPELSSFIESYLIIEESFSTTINASENFVATVDSAMFNTLYETKKAALAVAKELLANDVNINVAYPGVADAIAKITTVENDIKALEEAAAAYISAVAEIATKTTFKDKSAAIEKAQKLQAAGNVVGISGVSEANGALANYSAEIQILEGNSKTFVESVSRLDEEELTLAERRELIIIADSVKIGAEPTYDGVAEALESLAAHKEAYKTEVELINSAFASEVANVTTVAGASANQSRYYSVMELIKLLVASFK